jgi:hypothetical protein
MNASRLFALAKRHIIELDPILEELGLDEDIYITVKVGRMTNFPEVRNVAYTAQLSPTQYEIVFAPKWRQLTNSNYEAVLRHELGHVAHMAIPDIRKQLARRSIYLSSHDEPFSDEFAELVWGDNLYYDDDLIQTLEESYYDTRPEWLNL